MQSSKKHLLAIVLILIISSCNSTPKGVDPFYTNKGEWDDAEIPVIKPYQLIILNGRDDWMMNLEQWTFSSSLGDVKKINVINNYIFAFSKDTYFNHQAPGKEVWAVINPSQKIEKGFLTHDEYLKYIYKIGFKKEPVLYDMKEVSRYSIHHDVMDWKDLNKLLKH